MTRFITNPMIIKELRQRLRERRAWLLPTLYLLILSGTALLAQAPSLSKKNSAPWQDC